MNNTIVSVSFAFGCTRVLVLAEDGNHLPLLG